MEKKSHHKNWIDEVLNQPDASAEQMAELIVCKLGNEPIVYAAHAEVRANCELSSELNSQTSEFIKL